MSPVSRTRSRSSSEWFPRECLADEGAPSDIGSNSSCGDFWVVTRGAARRTVAREPGHGDGEHLAPSSPVYLTTCSVIGADAVEATEWPIAFVAATVSV